MRPSRHGLDKVAKTERLAIYLRDGMACCYCGTGIEDGNPLSLDHITPHSDGGQAVSGNLVTACRKCSSVRGNRSVHDFASDVAQYLDVDASHIVSHIAACKSRDMGRYRREAAELIKRRGSYAAALNGECR